MTVTIDKFGRILIPKKIRSFFGFKAGQELSIEITEDGLLAKPADQGKMELIMEDGLLVAALSMKGETAPPDLSDLIMKDRESRIDHFLNGIS